MTERRRDVDVEPLDATLTSGAGSSPGGPVVIAHGALTGKRLAHFRIERPLGKGGMGEVYLATDLALDRPVALKLLGRDVARDPSLRERFYREARAQARIQHPNVCHIYYIGEEDDQLFFAMEFIDGESLQDRLARAQQIPPEQALDVCRQAALGLREANRHGFTHRDVKPSNLMTDQHGVLKVVDFGIVKHHVEPAAPPGDEGVPHRQVLPLTGTRGTTLIGTPLYMAPEQARGEAVDFRADVYALGATLHHLIAGQPPFAGDTAMAIVSQHLADPRPRLPAGKRRALTTNADALCERMMAKRPADRFASYDDLITAIEQASPSFVRPAGFWVRAFALALDLLVIGVLSIPFAILTAGDGNVFLFGLAVPYAILLNGRWGRTVGKAALDIEVVRTGQTGRLGYGRAAKRFLAQWGLSYLAVGAATMTSLLNLGLSRTWEVVLGVFVGVLALVPPIGFGLASIWAASKRTIWDKLAGTQVRYRREG